MEEETTTTEVVAQDAGAQVAQPVDTDNTEAVQETDQPEQQTEAEQAPVKDDDVSKFAQAKGLELDSDNARKAIKMAMEAEKRMHQATQKSGELEKSMVSMSDQPSEQVAQATGQDPELLKRLNAMEVKGQIRDFFDSNPEARQYESEMTKIAAEAGLYGSAEAILKASYAMARSSDTNATASVKSQAKRDTLESLAHKQQAAVPRGNATNSDITSKEKPFAELSIAEMEAKLGTVRR